MFTASRAIGMLDCALFFLAFSFIVYPFPLRHLQQQKRQRHHPQQQTQPVGSAHQTQCVPIRPLFEQRREEIRQHQHIHHLEKIECAERVLHPEFERGGVEKLQGGKWGEIGVVTGDADIQDENAAENVKRYSNKENAFSKEGNFESL